MSRIPSREDPLARSSTTWLGGPIGSYARTGVSRWNPLTVLLLVTTAMFAFGIVQKAPCHESAWPADRQQSYSAMCYTDVPFLYRERGFAEGNLAYVDTGDYPPLEYPVLTGVVMQLTAFGTQLFGSGDADADSVLFFDLTVVVLFLCALMTVWWLRWIVPDRPYDALLFAAAPTLALAGTINWDLVAVALTVGALFAWSRSRPVVAGVLIGLGAAAKFYPLLLIGPLLLLALRSGRPRVWFAAVLAAVGAWLAVNLPLMLVASQSWRWFWSFNQGREAEFGSAWYVLGLAGVPVHNVNAVSLGMFALACVGIGVLTMIAPRRPRLAPLLFLTVAAFLLVNKVYSPQYVLWLLPLLALARPRWRDWVIWQSAEVFYWAMIWLHLGGQLFPTSGGPDRLYWLAVAIRLAGTVYLCVQVVRDILVPDGDVVREDKHVDDPIGGPFDRAPDATWHRRLLGAGRPPVREGAVP